MNHRKPISKGKLAIDIILLAGTFAACCAWITAENERAAAQTKAATVVEYATDCIPPVKEYAVPYGDTSFKSYMDYHAITNHDSAQWVLQKHCTTDGDGLRRYNDDYVIALGSYYADHIGERFDITLSTGESFTAVVGDFKADRHTDSTNRYTSVDGDGKNVVEFIVDTHGLSSKVKRMGDISYVDGFSGNIESIKSKGE